MNDEEIKAIEYINKILEYLKLYAHTGRESDFLREIDKKQIETVLNLIEKQKAEIELKQVRITNLENENNHLKLIAEEKDKIITEIIEEYEYNARINFKNFCEDELRKNTCIQDCINCAIKYFENKVKEE